MGYIILFAQIYFMAIVSLKELHLRYGNNN
jgi:hypothetical protein